MLETRKAAAGLPRMPLGITSASKLPVYVQLADQIRYLVITGELRAGTRLPSARSLSRNLGINRHTVLNAYGLLEQEGLVDVRGAGGTWVAPGAHGQAGRIPPDLLIDIEQIVERWEQAGLSRNELVTLIISHTGGRVGTPSARIAFVECNPHSLEHYARELQSALGVEVEAIFLDELRDRRRREAVAQVPLIVTTFFHYAEVHRLVRALAKQAPQVVAITVSPHLNVLDEISRLPKGTRLGIVYYAEDPYAEERLRRMADAVQSVGLKNVKIEPVLLPLDFTPESLEHLDALLVRPENIAQVRDRLPATVPLIEFRNTLDDASLHMLREVLQEVMRQPRGGSAAGDATSFPLRVTVGDVQLAGRDLDCTPIRKERRQGPRPSGRVTGASDSRAADGPR